jgi:hypothetical protein
MSNMTFQDQLGQRMSREIYAEEALENYQFIKYGTSEGKVKKATARSTVVGLTLKSQLQTVDNGSGFQIAKTGWEIGCLPEAIDKGVGYVKLGSGVSGATQGTYVMADSSGFAVPYTAPTIATIAKDGAPSTAELQAVLAQIINEGKVIAGRLIDGGDAGDLVRVDLDDRR